MCASSGRSCPLLLVLTASRLTPPQVATGAFVCRDRDSALK
jgi:hypothetical protein